MVKAITGASDTKALLAQAHAVVQSLERTMERDVAREVKKRYEFYAGQWSVKPRFKDNIEGGARGSRAASDLELRVFPDARPGDVGDASSEWTFHWTDKGTEPHPIVARKAPFLVFRTGYRPKTAAIARVGGPGKATGGFVSVKEVKRHPGTKPREFSVTLLKDYKRDYKRTLAVAVGKAARKSRRN